MVCGVHGSTSLRVAFVDAGGKGLTEGGTACGVATGVCGRERAIAANASVSAERTAGDLHEDAWDTLAQPFSLDKALSGRGVSVKCGTAAGGGMAV